MITENENYIVWELYKHEGWWPKKYKTEIAARERIKLLVESKGKLNDDVEEDFSQLIKYKLTIEISVV